MTGRPSTEALRFDYLKGYEIGLDGKLQREHHDVTVINSQVRRLLVRADPAHIESGLQFRGYKTSLDQPAINK